MKKVFYDHSQKERMGTVSNFVGEMSYAFYYFEDSPYKNSWLAYLITQNGYPKQQQPKNQCETFPLKVDYKFRLANYEILTPHQIHNRHQ